MKASPKVKEILAVVFATQPKTDAMRQLANDCGIAVTSLYRLFRAPQRARVSTLQRVASVLGCSVDDIIGDGTYE
jgi:DNA-binding phage protein